MIDKSTKNASTRMTGEGDLNRMVDILLAFDRVVVEFSMNLTCDRTRGLRYENKTGACTMLSGNAFRQAVTLTPDDTAISRGETWSNKSPLRPCP